MLIRHLQLANADWAFTSRQGIIQKSPQILTKHIFKDLNLNRLVSKNSFVTYKLLAFDT
jgi:hypothetical protein